MPDASVGEQVRCAVVVRPEETIDAETLAAIAESVGLTFAHLGSGGFGGGPVAHVYADASERNLLIEAYDPDLRSKALLVWAQTADIAIAIRAVLADRFDVWTEQTLRAQIESDDLRTPWALVALAMALGGGPAEPETTELLERALAHDDEEVREAAEYAQDVAREMSWPPVVMAKAADTGRRVPEAIRTAGPVSGDDWVTVRPGAGERAVPRPVTWLRLPAGADLETWAWDAGWNLMEVEGDDGTSWREEVYVDTAQRTALHVVDHPALGGVHAAVHGAEADATASALRSDLNAQVLTRAPDGLDRTGR